MILYAITDRALLTGNEAERTEQLIALAWSWAAGGVDFVQIREGDLPQADLIALASRMVQTVRTAATPLKVLINGKARSAVSVALTSGCDGIHLPGGLIPEELAATATQIREEWQSAQGPDVAPLLSVSCHSLADIRAARAAGIDLALFAPVFEKILADGPALRGGGLESLAEACRAARKSDRPGMPVVALGGVTLENAAQCIASGAAGIAAIRLFFDSGEERGWPRLRSTVGGI